MFWAPDVTYFIDLRWEPHRLIPLLEAELADVTRSVAALEGKAHGMQLQLEHQDRRREALLEYIKSTKIQVRGAFVTELVISPLLVLC